MWFTIIVSNFLVNYLHIHNNNSNCNIISIPDLSDLKRKYNGLKQIEMCHLYLILSERTIGQDYKERVIHILKELKYDVYLTLIWWEYLFMFRVILWRCCKTGFNNTNCYGHHSQPYQSNLLVPILNQGHRTNIKTSSVLTR